MFSLFSRKPIESPLNRELREMREAKAEANKAWRGLRRIEQTPARSGCS
jgi:hypothetical protein